MYESKLIMLYNIFEIFVAGARSILMLTFFAQDTSDAVTNCVTVSHTLLDGLGK